MAKLEDMLMKLAEDRMLHKQTLSLKRDLEWYMAVRGCLFCCKLGVCAV